MLVRSYLVDADLCGGFSGRRVSEAFRCQRSSLSRMDPYRDLYQPLDVLNTLEPPPLAGKPAKYPRRSLQQSTIDHSQILNLVIPPPPLLPILLTIPLTT